jgi:PAS domain S-box-containing protein
MEATVLRRIERRMQVTAQPDLRAYYHYLQSNPEETKALLGDMLIGVTNFFRDREAFEALERDVIPQLASAAVSAQPEKEEIRVWSAGCSTGEEAYSLAMLLNDQLQLDNSAASMQLFATDIDERAISVGRAGLYPQAIITDVPRGGYVRSNVSREAPQSSVPRKLSFADIHQRALEQSAPPSVIVDANADIATVFVDRSMRIKWFTPRATDIFSMLPVDTGRSLPDITHRLDYDNLAGDAALVFESLNMIEREVCCTDNRWYIARLLPYRSCEDHIDGTVLTFIDITKRRAAEEELRLGEERMRLVAESTRDYAIITLDEQGIITSWNKGAEMIFGYSKAEAEDAYYDFIFSAEDRASGVPESELLSVRTHGRSEDERWHLRKDGSRFFCSGEVTLLSGDNLQGYVKIVRDLTGHKRQHDVTLELLLPCDPLMVHADPTRLEQIIWNLVNNALKFTPPKGRVQLIASQSGDMARLEMEDAHVVAFDRPVAALDAAKSTRFDLIISDLGMPVMNGHELMSALRQLPLVKDVPAIALTGYGAQSDIQKSRQSGFDQHIGKPVSYDELIETIEALRRP